MKTKVKNRAKTLLTVNVEGSVKPLYIRSKETASLTERELDSPHVKALIREGHLVVIPEKEKKPVSDAKPVFSQPYDKGKKTKGGDG